MRFIETPIFTRDVVELLRDDEYRNLQLALALRPEAGALIRGAGGLRKIRWSLPGRGKRGGVRVIYYWATADGVIFMLTVYPKSRQADPLNSSRSCVGSLRRSSNEDQGFREAGFER